MYVFLYDTLRCGQTVRLHEVRTNIREFLANDASKGELLL